MSTTTAAAMLSRLPRAFSAGPSILSRAFSTTSKCSNPGQLSASAASASLSLPTPKPSNGLSYAGLPEHKVVLDIPPADDPLIHYLASLLQHDGRRHRAEKRASRALLFLHTLTRTSPLPLLRSAVERTMPIIRITQHRKSTKNVQIPVALNEKQQVRSAIKWILKASETRGGRTVEERFAREVILVLNGSSSALRQKESVHTQAMINR